MTPLHTLQSRIAEILPDLPKDGLRPCSACMGEGFREGAVCEECTGAGCFSIHYTPTLADVLRAIEKVKPLLDIRVRGYQGLFEANGNPTGISWDLTADLSHQSEATLKSLLELLA